MPEKLTPPVRYRHEGEPAPQEKTGKAKKQRRASASKKESTLVQAKKQFGSIKMKSDWFVTGGIDIPFFALTIVILAIGLVMLFSASYPYHYFIRQLIFAVAGVAIMLFVSKLNFKVFKAAAPYLLGITILLLIIVLFYHTGVSTDEGEQFKRYIKIPGLPLTFQPSDIAKFTLVTTLATYISMFSREMKTFKYGIAIPAAIIGVYCLLIMAENHLSGTIIVGVIGLALKFAGGTNRKIFIIGLAMLAAVVLVVWMFPEILPKYIQTKLQAFTDKSFEPLGARWQTNNSLYAIGSGGFFGLGLGNSRQKYLYVSQPQNDFIFSIVCEELGFIGAVVIILLFAALVVRGFIIALRSPDKFAALTVIGIMVQVGVQVGFNILVVTDSIPNTGIALPFFSYGGTALVMLLFEMGVVLGISRKANQRKVIEE
jgi:cell division protein FtsW